MINNYTFYFLQWNVSFMASIIFSNYVDQYRFKIVIVYIYKNKTFNKNTTNTLIVLIRIATSIMPHRREPIGRYYKTINNLMKI